MDEATCTIVQKRFLRGRQTLTLEGDKLKAEYRRGLSLDEYQFDLQGLLPEPLRIRRVPAGKIVALVLCIVLGLILMPLGIIGDDLGWGAALIGVAVLGSLLVIFGIAGWIPTAKEFVNVVVLEGPGGRVILWPDLPNKEQFDQFLAVLSTRIRKAQQPEQDLLRQLRRAEIIDDWGYERAMELFEQNGIAGGSNSPGTEQ